MKNGDMHAGQIVLLAKHLRGEEWRTLSIPRGKSKEYDERLRRERTGRSRSSKDTRTCKP